MVREGHGPWRSESSPLSLRGKEKQLQASKLGQAPTMRGGRGGEWRPGGLGHEELTTLELHSLEKHDPLGVPDPPGGGSKL